MKRFCLILLFLLLGTSISTFSQSNLSDSSGFIKKPINNENILYIKSKVVNNPVSEPVHAKLPTSGLEAYERLLNYYESEKVKAIKQGINTDEINSKIAQLKEKIRFEKIKNQPVDDQQGSDFEKNAKDSKILK